MKTPPTPGHVELDVHVYARRHGMQLGRNELLAETWQDWRWMRWGWQTVSTSPGKLSADRFLSLVRIVICQAQVQVSDAHFLRPPAPSCSLYLFTPIGISRCVPNIHPSPKDQKHRMALIQIPNILYYL